MPNKNYQMIFNFNPEIFKVLLKYLDPQKNEKILEIGCGRGDCIKKIEKYTKNVVGIDISKAALKNAVTPRICYGDATNLKFEKENFDKIYSLHTIEHIPNLKKFFSEINRTLKFGGICIIIYPFELIRGLQALGTALIRYKNPLVIRKIHLHKLTPRKIKKIIKNTNLSHVKSKIVLALGIHYITVLKKTDKES